MGNDVAPDVEQLAHQTAAGITVPQFNLCLDVAGEFPRARVWWLGTSRPPAQLLELQSRLMAPLRGRIRDEHGGYSPHLTIRRDARHIDAQAVRPIDWRVRDFVLVRSQPSGAYEVIATWPLRH